VRRVSPTAFVLAHTRARTAPFVPELTLALADDSLGLWEASQARVDAADNPAPPPFWAFVWAGGQALARHLLDHPDLVAGRLVVDVASGSGVVAIAAARAGARQVVGYDVDELSVAAIAVNARLNRVQVESGLRDVTELTVPAGTLVTVGDVFYDEKIAAVMLASLTRLGAGGAEVLVGDPHRSYLPSDRLEPLAYYDVDVETDIEDSPVKHSVVARLRS
jgi:predicted nicotinamide N-methyase